jgi:16S rRNA (adenine1518-N6/adenine1519-N6)-dimethyltransferase
VKRDRRTREERPRRAKDTLRDLQVRPSKERGQNFLIRPEVIESIVNFAAAPGGMHLVEIGPGMGALTQHLATAGRLTLIEIEPNFCAHLRAKYPHVEIINQDVREVDFASIGDALFVFGNIPYVFSTDIVFTLIRYRQVVRHAVLMVQREFAERLAASPGGRDYGSISVAVQLHADVELGPIVPGTSFHPPTSVESQVMKLTFLPEPRVPVGDPAFFETVVRAAFSQRRKKLINSLLSRGRWSKEQILAALAGASISPDVRPEQLTISQFAELAAQLR